MIFKVTDLKEYAFCPRIIYFTYVLPLPVKLTTLMEEGSTEHESVSKLIKRRSIRRFGLDEGKVELRLRMFSEKLRLSGILDMCIFDNSDKAYPVDFKRTRGKVYFNHRVQLCGYSLLLEETRGVKVEWGFIYTVPERKIFTVEIDDRLRGFILDIIRDMEDMISTERFPERTRRVGWCVDCEYRNWCDDIE